MPQRRAPVPVASVIASHAAVVGLHIGVELPELGGGGAVEGTRPRWGFARGRLPAPDISQADAPGEGRWNWPRRNSADQEARLTGGWGSAARREGGAGGNALGSAGGRSEPASRGLAADAVATEQVWLGNLGE